MAANPPADKPEARREWLRKRWHNRQSAEANRYRDSLVKWYGEEAAKDVKYAETFEVCEFGRQPTDDEVRELFPFLPKP